MIALRQCQSVTKLRLRSLCDASWASQEKARKNKEGLRPYTQRPQTTAFVARRLVESALGKRCIVSTEQINAEKKQLKIAKGYFYLSFAQIT